MKQALMMLSVFSLIAVAAMNAEARPSKKETKAFAQKCKAENPGIKGKALRSCIKEKAKSK